jgi:hypothetical protein
MRIGSLEQLIREALEQHKSLIASYVARLDSSLWEKEIVQYQVAIFESGLRTLLQQIRYDASKISAAK